MKKKLMLLSSFALATVLVVGQMSFAAGSDDSNQGMGNMMNGNGMSGMMQNENMGNMMNAMNSPEGQEMMNACGGFMDSYGDDETEAEEQSNL
jgi:hypothetical protein